MRSLKKLFIFCLAAMLIGFAGYEVSAQKGKKWKKDNNNRREMQKRRSEKKNEKRERRAEKRRGGDDDDDRRERYGRRGNDRREAIKRRIEDQRERSTRRARYDRRDDYRRANDNRREILERRAENRRDYLKREKKYEKMIAKQQREYYKDQRKYNKQIRKREKDQRRDRRDDYGGAYYPRERDYPQTRYYRQERYDQPENNVLTMILGTLGMAFGQTAPSYDSYDNNYDQNRYYDDYSYVARDDYYYEDERNAPPVYYQNDPYANQAYGNDVLPIDTGKDWLNQILGVALTSFLSQNGNDYLSAVEPYQPFYSGFQQDNSYLYDPYYLDGYDMGYAPAY